MKALTSFESVKQMINFYLEYDIKNIFDWKAKAYFDVSFYLSVMVSRKKFASNFQ